MVGEELQLQCADRRDTTLDQAIKVVEMQGRHETKSCSQRRKSLLDEFQVT